MVGRIEYTYSNGLVSTVMFYKLSSDNTPYKTISFEYNSLNQITLFTITYGSTLVRTIRYTYNSNGSVASRSITDTTPTPAPDSGEGSLEEDENNEENGGNNTTTEVENE